MGVRRTVVRFLGIATQCFPFEKRLEWRRGSGGGIQPAIQSVLCINRPGREAGILSQPANVSLWSAQKQAYCSVSCDRTAPAALSQFQRRNREEMLCLSSLVWEVDLIVLYWTFVFYFYTPNFRENLGSVFGMNGVFCYLLTYSMEQSPSWEANSKLSS
jgi:hypothetical protein